MSDIEFFQMKNPHASMEYCDAAVKLYHILLWLDAFENNVQIEKYYESFIFIFPNGQITIRALMTPAHVFRPYYIAYINGAAMDVFFEGIVSIALWLKKNWDDLVKDA